MTWEGQDFNGQQTIMEKLNTFPTVKHQIGAVDTQVISNQAILVYVTGKLVVR